MHTKHKYRPDKLNSSQLYHLNCCDKKIQCHLLRITLLYIWIYIFILLPYIKYVIDFFPAAILMNGLFCCEQCCLKCKCRATRNKKKFIESCSIYIAVFICHLSISNSILMPSMAKWRKDKIKSSFLLFCVMRFLASKNKTICYANKRILAKQ